MLKTFQPSHTNFLELANVILNNVSLHVNDKTFRICEIEFYYHNNEHPDTYTHCSDEQQMNCKFYFHKYKNGSYKSGTYKGLDITLSPNKNTYFGCLIRSLYDVNNNIFIEGPCKLVNAILSQYECNDVKEFVENKELPLDIYDDTYGFYIMDDNMRYEQIFCGPRIGLSDKYPAFRDLKYRYAIKISNIKKQRKTFEKCE